jgi:hypothetical protein
MEAAATGSLMALSGTRAIEAHGEWQGGTS